MQLMLEIEEEKETVLPEKENEAQMFDRMKQEIVTDASIGEWQRELAEEDMRFLNLPDGMWEGFHEVETANRVRLQFPIMAIFMKRVLGEWNQNRIGVIFKPGDNGKASDKDAELLNSLYKRDFRKKGMGKKAIDNAVLEVFNCGTGAFVFGEHFVDDSDHENELQNIELRPIYNAYANVLWGDGTFDLTKSDAKRCTVLNAYTKETFERIFPGKTPVSVFDPEELNTDNVNSQGTDPVHVGTMYHRVWKNETFFKYDNEITGEIETFSEAEHKKKEGDLKNLPFMKKRSERTVKTVHVEKTVLSGADILRGPTRIAGKYIPVIQIFGERVFIGNEEWYKGLVRDLKDPSRLLNQQLSSMSENAASGRNRIPIVSSDQVQTPEAKESMANPGDKAYLILDPITDKDGNPIPPAILSYFEPFVVDPNQDRLVSLVPQLMREVTGSLPGEVKDPDASGKAQDAARKTQDLSTQYLMENIAAGVEWSGTVYASKAQDIYKEPRTVKVINVDDSESSVRLMRTALDEKTGKLTLENDITNKNFDAYSDTGPQFETQRKEVVENALAMMEKFGQTPGNEEIVKELGAIAIDNMPGDGFDTIKKQNHNDRLLAGTIEAKHYPSSRHYP